MRPDSSTAPAVLAGAHAVLLDYWELTKPSVVWLILMSTAVGFYMGTSGSWPLILLVHTIIGTALLAAGTGALNQWWEREADAKMRRTENRPLPAGRLRPGPALVFGICLAAAGTIYLWTAVNVLAAVLGFLTLACYLWLYTPLKSRTPAATFVGAFPGAMPPLIGWAAARASIGIEGWVLFAMLFLWQFPHFYAIAWMYREDYQRSGHPDAPGRRAGRHLDRPPGCLLQPRFDPGEPRADAVGHGRLAVRRRGARGGHYLSLLRDSYGSGKDPATGAPPAASVGLLSTAVVLFPHRR